VLIQIEIHEWARSFINIDVFAVSDNPDNGRDTMAVFNLYRFANGTFTRPVFFGHQVIYNNGFWPFRRIG